MDAILKLFKETAKELKTEENEGLLSKDNDFINQKLNEIIDQNKIAIKVRNTIRNSRSNKK